MSIPDRILRPIVEGPDAEGFRHIRYPGNGHNAGYGEILARTEDERIARVRIATGERSSNVRGGLHGGFMLSFLDQAIFVGPAVLGLIDVSSAVTLSLSSQFMAAGVTDKPLDCLVEVVRETGRLVFVRGIMEQGDGPIMSFDATLRKFSPRSEA